MWSQPLAVIVAHPDDEVLGFGGAIARAVDEGADVDILILATGITARGDANATTIETLRDQARRAAETLGAAPPEFGDYPDNRMDTVALLDVVQRVEVFIANTRPTSVLTHHARDLNVDHRVTAQAVLTACRPQPGATVQRLYAGEVLSSSEWSEPRDRFIPNTYLDIEAVLNKKLEALAHYRDEVRDFPHPRSFEALEALAHRRGSEAGLRAAEAFELIRDVQD